MLDAMAHTIQKILLHLPTALALLLVAACGRDRPKPETAFYHWQTSLAPTPYERNYLRETGCNVLYVKYFDVAWEDGQAVPLAILQTDTSSINGLEIVPTVFITNEVFSKMPQSGLPELATKILHKINALQTGKAPSEIQFDCDWSPSTREAYFAFLRLARQQLGNKKPLISATIRLHQARYPDKTGVPPVDRGMLMCYNMGDVEDGGTPNSILQLDVLRSYLNGMKTYPLPLDVALPTFAWGVLYRFGNLAQLFNDLRAEEMADSTRFERLSEYEFRVKRNTYLQGHYVYEDDHIRLEEVAPDTLLAASDLLRARLPNEPRRVAFFHLDESLLRHYPAHLLNKAAASLR
jgi:hypothetical protein